MFIRSYWPDFLNFIPSNNLVGHWNSAWYRLNEYYSVTLNMNCPINIHNNTTTFICNLFKCSFKIIYNRAAIRFCPDVIFIMILSLLFWKQTLWEAIYHIYRIKSHHIIDLLSDKCFSCTETGNKTSTASFLVTSQLIKLSPEVFLLFEAETLFHFCSLFFFFSDLKLSFLRRIN